MLYDGDLHQHDKILTWLTSQDIFEIKNEIEEVNRKMLDKLLEENEFLAVYFCELKIMFKIVNNNSYYYCTNRRSGNAREHRGHGKTREHRQ